MTIGTFTESFDRPIDPVDRLLRRRVILLSGPIDTDRANDVMARQLYLEGEDDEAPIELRINSPGGEVLSGLAIVDTIAQLTCPVASARSSSMRARWRRISSAARSRSVAWPWNWPAQG